MKFRGFKGFQEEGSLGSLGSPPFGFAPPLPHFPIPREPGQLGQNKNQKKQKNMGSDLTPGIIWRQIDF